MIAGVKLRNNFSKVATDYEDYAGLQAKIGKRLLESLDHKEYISILDVGMGTGLLTKRIVHKYPQAKVWGCDFSEGMVLCAREKSNFRPVCANSISLCFKDENFDLAISNLMYQWIPDLEKAFNDVCRVMRNDADFVFSCFGSQTLKELVRAYDFVVNQNKTNDYFDNTRLPDRDKIMMSLRAAGFKNCKINSYVVKQRHKDVFAIVRWLKNIGANQIRKPKFIGRDAWGRISEFYRINFSDNKDVFATFEVIEVSAEK